MSAAEDKRTGSPGLWAGLFLASLGAVVGLKLSGTVDKTTAFLLFLGSLALLIPLYRAKMHGRTTTMPPRSKSARKRYILRLAMAMAVYLSSLVAAEWLIEDRGVSGVAAYLLAIVPGLAVASIFWIFARLVIEEPDEFIRLLYVRQTMVATGLAMSVASIWGFLEFFGLIFHLDAFWWPAIWCFGLALGSLFNKLTMGSSGRCA